MIMKTKELTTNNWRYKSLKRLHIKNVNIYPYKVGSKFTKEDIESLTDWLTSMDCLINSAKNTVIEVLLPSKFDYNDVRNFYSILESNSYSKIINRDKEELRKQKKDREDAELNSIINEKSYKWIIKNFGESSMNMYNMKALMMFLDGVDDNFKGMINSKWIDGATRLNVIEGNSINFDKLKAIYLNNNKRNK